MIPTQADFDNALKRFSGTALPLGFTRRDPHGVGGFELLLPASSARKLLGELLRELATDASADAKRRAPSAKVT